MRSNHKEQLAEWHACGTFFGGLEPMVEFDYEQVLADFAKDGTLPEGWNIWSPFENHEPSDIVALVETQKETFLMFHYEIVGAGTYFAQDGNYGSAELLAIVNTEKWTEADFQEIEGGHDWDAPEKAIEIADRYDKEGK
jgi:hypothetical protein